MLKAIIIEDELHSQEALKNLLTDYCPEVKVLGMAASVEEGIKMIRHYAPTLLFLDIQMETGTGFDVLEQVESLRFGVIFTTAHQHYALKAIKFSAIDYLLKPIDIDELKTAVAKVAQKQSYALDNKQLETLLANRQTSLPHQHTITLATFEGLEFIKVSDIICCQASGSYTNFHLKNNRTLLVSKHLKEYEHLLSDYRFYRIHQSFLVNMDEVVKYIKTDGGAIVMSNGMQATVSSRKKEEFIQLMQSSNGI